MKKFCDHVAHSKPIEHRTEENYISEIPKDINNINLDPKWMKLCNEHTVMEIYDDIKSLQKDLLEKSGIKITETLSYGSSKITYMK